MIIDCLTLLLTNLMFQKDPSIEEHGILGGIGELAKTCKTYKGTVVVVSNEVGMGIVPDNELARRFRDMAGRANQVMAEAADEVYVCFSGIPVKIKG